MRSAILTFVLSMTMICGAVSAQEAPTTNPTELMPVLVNASDPAAVKAAMGKDVILDGVIESASWSGTGKVMKATFRGAKNLAIVVFEKKKADFDAAYNGDFAKTLIGSHVRISGNLKDYKGEPEIMLSRPSQITILELGSAKK